MKILITGGFGFVGARLAHALGQRGHAIRLATRKARPAPTWLTTAEVVTIDWNDPSQLRNACSDVNAVAHLAGMNARNSSADPAAALAFNGSCTEMLVDSAIETGVDRFLYLSTGHVYANPLRGTVDEETPTRGDHPYATSHLAGEGAVRTTHARGQIDGVVVRLSNAFGAPMELDTDCWTLLVNDLVRQASVSGEMVLRSSGVQRRDFIPMGDAIRAIEYLLTQSRDRLDAGVFNVGGGYSPTVLDMTQRVADRVERATGTRPIVRRLPPAAGERTEDLTYVRDRLLASGFVPSNACAVDDEIDDLIQFCALNAAVPTL